MVRLDAEIQMQKGPDQIDGRVLKLAGLNRLYMDKSPCMGAYPQCGSLQYIQSLTDCHHANMPVHKPRTYAWFAHCIWSQSISRDVILSMALTCDL